MFKEFSENVFSNWKEGLFEYRTNVPKKCTYSSNNKCKKKMGTCNGYRRCKKSKRENY